MLDVPVTPSADASRRSGMGRVVHLHQMLRAHVRVALGRRQTTVTQQLLDEAEIGAFPEHVRREGMTQRVGRHAAVQTGTLGLSSDDTVGAPSCESTAALVPEERT